MLKMYAIALLSYCFSYKCELCEDDSGKTVYFLKNKPYILLSDIKSPFPPFLLETSMLNFQRIHWTRVSTMRCLHVFISWGAVNFRTVTFQSWIKALEILLVKQYDITTDHFEYRYNAIKDLT